ncbi:phosphatidylserine decarboxylase [Eremomyces bilateralis CBS 781.70]|uniref:Phosphatidylserine decarboxylase proenzyme 1, mitochondrial n=1 Tax=Eremomyces bilateralis CBS 781.70 TaxID=1392243 RepID=A0A6G1G118_9PEZI|nr:phosphatidylserine decarboxylase [Eremomyces bilateralis CBS 781.70]KAF1811805.1 phosphatidylserine decarboxylase [Eremomyces bilateralis CBS 781.70]
MSKRLSLKVELQLGRRFWHQPPPASRRGFCNSPRCLSQKQDSEGKQSFRARLGTALRNTKIEWKPIPIALGIAFLGGVQFYHVQRRERERVKELQEELEDQEMDGLGRPRDRRRIRPSEPWQVQVMTTLPLKAFSRLWGWFNSLDIPYYLRVPGFKLYSYLFNVKLDEVAEPDLHTYPNLAAFFYRELKQGARPSDPDPNAILSPADGKIVQYGLIEGGEVEQVKGVTYSLDALLGTKTPSTSGTTTPQPSRSDSLGSRTNDGQTEEDNVRADEEFAQVNGIHYTLKDVLSGSANKDKKLDVETPDQSTTPVASSEAEVRADLALAEASTSWWAPTTEKTATALHYCVIYLAPGDYHRFHSPVAWVVERRRHFAGELFSVHPYLVKTLPGLFTLNERVVLLGRWRWGFFSYTPVGATNVGSIKINFDKELRTNSLITDTAADAAAEESWQRGEQFSGFVEATYEGASKVLGGHALKRGEEMGGFQLGSTIVMVFEAPKGARPSFDEGYKGGERKGGYKWSIEKGQTVKVGQALGHVVEE